MSLFNASGGHNAQNRHLSITFLSFPALAYGPPPLDMVKPAIWLETENMKKIAATLHWVAALTINNQTGASTAELMTVTQRPRSCVDKTMKRDEFNQNTFGLNPKAVATFCWTIMLPG